MLVTDVLAATTQMARDQTLTEFVRQFWDGQQLRVFLLLMASGSLGMIANWAVRWARGEIRGCLTVYLFRDNPRATALSLFTYTGAVLAAMQADVVHVGEAGTFIGWANVAWLGASNGYFIDNIVNKGERAAWTPQERAARQQPTNQPPEATHASDRQS